MKKSLSLITCLIFTCASSNSFAQYSHARQLLIQDKLKESCSRKANINLQYAASEIPIYSNISYKELVARGGQKHGVQLFGLYTNEINLQTNYRVGEYTIENNSCFFISDITFTVKITPNIYIANEAAQFPCMRQKVYEHEMNHHKYFMDALNAENSNLQRYIKERFENIPVKHHPDDVSQITQFVKDNVSQIQSNFIAGINNRKAPYDRNLDDPNNTAREQRACQNELFHLQQLYRR